MFQNGLPVKNVIFIKKGGGILESNWKQIKAKEELPWSPDSPRNYVLLKYFIK